MKAILISIQPKWVAKILNGEKTIEVRKTMPKCDLPIDVYIYCTKDSKHKLEYCDINEGCWSANDGGDYFNGKVIAKFTLNKVEEIENHILHDYMETKSLSCVELEKQSCLDLENLYKYLGINNGYAIYISDLEIFDKPKELNEFYKGFKNKYYKREFGLDTYIDKYGVLVQPTKKGYEYTYKLIQAPQSWCYVEVED